MTTPRTVVWYSCGAASTIAAKLILEENPAAIVAYCDTGSEHSDNKRYLADCERWFGKKILILRSAKYRDIWDVFEKTKYLCGVKGARCTTELKKLVRREFERPDDIQVFGFDVSEKKRAIKFNKHNPEATARFPLIEQRIGKQECFERLQIAGIALPRMYKMGYRNNNCIGCVKGQAGYWNKIRRDFPDVFARMAAVERELDVAINKKYIGKKRTRVFLDELDPNVGKHKDLDIQCGLFCGEI